MWDLVFALVAWSNSDALLASICRKTCGSMAILLFLARMLEMHRTRPLRDQPYPPGPKWAVVTGASSGIGRSISLELAKRGFNIILVARTEKALQAAAEEVENLGVEAKILVSDLTADGAPQDLHNRVLSALNDKPPLVLVNNAGFAITGNLVDLDPNAAAGMIQLNCIALTQLTRLMAPPMVQRGQGWILNISSMAGLGPGPYQAVYSATKSYVTSFSQAVHYELQGTGVRVVCACPGATYSNFGAVSGADKSLIFKVPGAQQSSTAVAKEAVQGMFSGKAIAVIGPFNKSLYRFNSLICPRQLLLFLTDRLWRSA